MEFINQKTNGRKEAAEKYKIVEEARIARACANLCYCLFNVCVYLPSPNTYFLYRWHENLFAPWRRERERQTLSVLSGLIFLSPDLIFIFVSAVCFFVTQASLHLLSTSNRFELVVSYFFCLFSVSFFYLL